MATFERNGLVLLSALLPACMGIVDPDGVESSRRSPAGTPSGPATTPETECSSTLVPTRVRKLTDQHYARLVSELLPSVTVPHVVTPGTELALIKDDAKFVVRGPLAAQYWDGAFEIAKRAVLQPDLVPCAPVPVDAAARRACAAQLADSFGHEVFRRPLNSADRDPLLAVYDVGAETSFEKGVELMVAALLQSADFLYRTELGDPAQPGPEVSLAPYEVASLVSFLFLGGAPDDALYAAAASGALATEPGVSEQVARLLALPAAQAHVTELTADVLGASGALTANGDAEVPAPLRQSMHEEARDFVHDNLFGQKTLADLFTSRSAKVDPTLAEFYGVALTGAARVELPAGERSGILTRAATVLGLPTGSRAVHRGLFVAHHYLCRVLAPPPASLQGEIAQTLALGLNERQVAELRASKATCAGCHMHFDGLGLAFEHYDFTGKYLTERDGAPVDAHGDLSGTDVDGTFANVLELSERLSRSKSVAQCLPERLSGHALGLELADGEKCAVEQLIEPWLAGERRLGELVPLLGRSRFFLTRSKVN